MKISRDAISDLALEIIYAACDDALSDRITTDLMVIEKAELALHIKRSLAEGKKRIVIDVTGQQQGGSDE